MDNIRIYLASINFDFWTLWGLIGQGFFFLRLIIQWLKSEKAKQTIVPKSFWWLGIIGASMLLVYSIVRSDLVFFLTSIIQFFLYSRNLAIANHQMEKKL